VTRQRAWQLRMQKQGRCQRCGASPIVTSECCAGCAPARRRQNREAVARWKARRKSLTLVDETYSM